MAKINKWHLEPKETTWSTSLYWRDSDPFDVVITPDQKHARNPNGLGYRRSLSQSRNFNMTNKCVTMTHIPTGIESHGRFFGFYTRSEIQKMHESLMALIFQNLENKVAKHLKIRGRQNS